MARLNLPPSEYFFYTCGSKAVNLGKLAGYVDIWFSGEMSGWHRVCTETHIGQGTDENCQHVAVGASLLHAVPSPQRTRLRELDKMYHAYAQHIEYFSSFLQHNGAQSCSRALIRAGLCQADSADLLLRSISFSTYCLFRFFFKEKSSSIFCLKKTEKVLL